jgi:hypothetical protein
LHRKRTTARPNQHTAKAMLLLIFSECVEGKQNKNALEKAKSIRAA